MQAKTLGLNMIVKNESHVIVRLLKSVLPVIDYWTIVDTGSTDGTQEIIKDFFKENNVPGELIEVEWIDDFSYARNIALKALEPHVDFGMWIDADEELILAPGFDKQKMLNPILDCISFKTVYGKVDYTRKNIWKTNYGFGWSGPIHELLGSVNEKNGSVAENVHVIVRPEGSSWTNVKEKYTSHAKILEEYALKTNDPRWVFYTAQSYRDSQQFEKSIEWYNKRASLVDGFYEEQYVSLFMAARLSEAIGKSKDECTAMYQKAHAADPLRGEAIKSMVQMYQRLNDWENAYVFSLYGTRYNRNNPYPHRILFLDNMLYDFEMLELHALSCFYTKKLDEGSRCYWLMRKQLDELGPGYLTEEMMGRVYSNEQYFPKPVQQAMSMQTLPKRGTNFTPPKKKRK